MSSVATERPSLRNNTRLDTLRTFGLLPQLDCSVSHLNQDILAELHDYEVRMNKGCFFLAMASLANAFYPEKPLPTAQDILTQATRDHPHLLFPKTHLIAPGKLAQALQEISPSWGFLLSAYSLNQKGRDFLGQMFMDAFGLPASNSDPNYLPRDELTNPYALLLHQEGAGALHIITIDGTPHAQSFLADLEHRTIPHRAIASLEFQACYPFPHPNEVLT